MSHIPGNMLWLQSSEEGTSSTSTVMQEILHNAGLSHGWNKYGVEREDYTTCM